MERPSLAIALAIALAFAFLAACEETSSSGSPEADAGAPSADAGGRSDGDKCADPVLREITPGDATDDARGTGQLFENVEVEGVTDVVEQTLGTSIVDVNHDGRLDLVIVYQKSGAKVLLNDGCFRFSVAAEVSIRPRAQVPNLVDFDRDGWLDVFITHNRGNEAAVNPGNSLLLTRGKTFGFVDVGEALGVRNAEAYNRQSSIGDIDGDGWLDIAIGADNIGDQVRLGRPRQRLYRFVPKGDRFEDGTFVDLGGTDAIPGFGGDVMCDADVDRAGPGITLRDMDDDGDLDLVQAYHSDMNLAKWDSPCASGEYWQGMYAWRNLLEEEGTLRFEQVTSGGLTFSGRMRYDTEKKYYLPDPDHPEAHGLPYVTMADVNNDGLLDVVAVGPTDPGWHVQAGMVSGRFWYNRGDFKFEEATKAAGLEALNWTYRQWDEFFDAGQAAEGDKLLPGVCNPQTNQWPLCSMLSIMDHQPYSGDVVMEDFDNDGWVDLLFVDRRELPVITGTLRNMLFMNQGDGTFRPVPTTWSGMDTNSMAAVAGDLNDDGLVDVVLVKSPGNSTGGLWEPTDDRIQDAVYWNTGAHGARKNHWLRLRFSGVDDHRVAGARVFLRRAGGTTLLGMRAVFSNHNYKSGNALEAHFGLGKETTADAEVRLIGGRTMTFAGLAADGVWDLDLETGERQRVDTSER